MSAAPEGLGVLAHELRAPVAALAALAAGVVDAPPALRRRACALALDAVRDIERLLADPALLAYERAAVDVADLVAATAAAGGERVVTTVAPGLVVEGDATRLRQALANLVANGLRHGATVSIRAERAGEGVAIVVADDGPGVADGIDPFARGVSGAGSTGLGLWLARTVAEAHGGTVVHVPTASGATFRLALPPSSASSL